MTKPPPPTRNGFTRPLHPQQLMSWLGYFLQVMVYILLILPTFTQTEKIAISIPYFAIVLGYNACFLLASFETHQAAWVSEDNIKTGFKCRWCEKWVKARSKHCRACNICRLDFDHHCFFLNNCVTKRNYPLFLWGIILLGISSIVTTFLCIFVMMGNEYDKGALMVRAAEFYGVKKVPKAAFYVFLCLMLIEMLGIQVFMIYLYALHFLLYRRQISTFDLIQFRREQELQRAAQRM